ncbi:MAG: hypothetical protein IJ446_02930 [Oscillospiraceae bacterium]|nr:hypothetical protein [Oscillospiraceae bacterium]
MKKIMKRLLSAVIMLITALTMCAVPVSAATIKLNKTSVDLPVGYQTTVKVSGTKKKVKWYSSDSTVIKVSVSGNTAKVVGKKTGTAYLYAKVSNKTLKCKFTVKKAFITTSKSSVTVDKGDTSKVTLNVKGSHSLGFSNSNKSVCSVSFGEWVGDSIRLTIKGKKAGTSVIKVYAKGYPSSTAKTIKVTVNGNNNEYYEDDDSTVLYFDGTNWYVIEYETELVSVDDDNTDSASVSSSKTEEVIEIVNKKRAAAGLSSLESDDKLNKAAAERAKEISRSFSHTRPDGSSCFSILKEYDVSYWTVGENIAYGSSTPSDVMEMWMNSAGHKSNIMSSSFTRIGVGHYVDSSGTHYWVQIFAG